MRNARRRGHVAAESVTAGGEEIVDVGMVWAAQLRNGVPLLFRARRQYLVALTDRRLLVFERRGQRPRDAPGPADLVLGKRYEFFTAERTRSLRPLLQVILRGATGNGLVLEFRPSQRPLGRELLGRLTPSVAAVSPPSAVSGPSAEDAERAAADAFWGAR